MQKELERIPIPTLKSVEQNGEKSKIPLVNLTIYNHEGERITEISVDINHIPLMVSLSQ